MTNEAVLVTEYEPPIDFIVADGAGIEKGALLKITDPMTAAAATATDDVLAGIAAREKTASDGRVRLSVYRRGIFRVYASGAINVGDKVGSIASYANYVASNNNTVNLSGSKTLGLALETAANGEQFLIEVGIR